MSCPAYDWKAYALGELSPKERRDAELHAASCFHCRGEAAELRLTLDALSTLREEEIPRRIAFVSDKVFEPRWWQKVSHIFLRPSFAAGALIAAAILVHAFARPAATIDSAAGQTQMQAQIQAQIQTKVEAEVSRRIDSAVAQAVALSQQQSARNTGQLLADTEKRYAEQRKADFAAAAANYEILSKQLNRIYAENTGLGLAQ